MTTLPDMDYCRRRGWVRYPAEPQHGRTVLGCARKYRRGQLTATAYTRLHRERLYAAGLTARGTVRKRSGWRKNALVLYD